MTNRFQINQNWIRKKIGEVEEDDHGTIAVLIEHQVLKTIIKNNKSFYILWSSCILLKTS